MILFTFLFTALFLLPWSSKASMPVHLPTTVSQEALERDQDLTESLGKFFEALSSTESAAPAVDAILNNSSSEKRKREHFKHMIAQTNSNLLLHPVVFGDREELSRVMAATGGNEVWADEVLTELELCILAMQKQSNKGISQNRCAGATHTAAYLLSSMSGLGEAKHFELLEASRAYVEAVLALERDAFLAAYVTTPGIAGLANIAMLVEVHTEEEVFAAMLDKAGSWTDDVGILEILSGFAKVKILRRGFYHSAAEAAMNSVDMLFKEKVLALEKARIGQ